MFEILNLQLLSIQERNENVMMVKRKTLVINHLNELRGMHLIALDLL